MSDRTEALALVRRIDATVVSLAEDVRYPARGMARVEEGFAAVHHRLDRLEEPMIRIERQVEVRVTATQQRHAP